VQRVSANAIQALKDALTAAFWFKKDLYGYAKAAVGGDPTFLSGIGWTDPDVYKRDSVSTFVDRLVREQDEHQDLLIALLVDVAAMDDFPSLRRVEDSAAKVVEARAAVARLRPLVKAYEQTLLERQQTRERINADQAKAVETRATTQRLEQLKDQYVRMLQMAPQQRGYALERLLRDLFDAFDLDPRSSFRVVSAGDQIDGGFTIDGAHFIVEAKFEQAPSDRGALDGFSVKVEMRADITQGLFVAIAGFQLSAVERHSHKGSPMILMTGEDLFLVLDGRIDLRELLRRKIRHAAMTGEILFTASAILAS
jgi:hypothetical protein